MMQDGTVLIRLMARTSRLYKARLNLLMAAHDIDLSSEMCGVIVELWEKDGRHLQELAETFKKDKGGMNKIVNSLEQRNLVSRTEDADDRRRKLITLTTAGKALEDKVWPLVQKLRKKTLANISNEQLRDTEKILYQIICNLEDNTER